MWVRDKLSLLARTHVCPKAYLVWKNATTLVLIGHEIWYRQTLRKYLKELRYFSDHNQILISSIV